MSYNYKIYLNNNLELQAEKPQELMAEVTVKGSEYFGNYHTSYFPLCKDGKELVFNGWSLNEFYINRQWSKSYLMKCIVSKKDMPYINLSELIKKYKYNVWYNNEYDELELNSKILHFVIDFLDEIPKEISTYAGVDAYFAFTKVSTSKDLYNFCALLSDSFDKLTATEYTFINKLFIRRWKAITNIDC